MVFLNDNRETLIGTIKVISMMASGAFGVLGLLTKYRDDAGRITRWGKLALGGILISSTFSLALFVLETQNAKQAASEAKNRYEETKKDLETTLDRATRNLEKTAKLETSVEATLTEQKRAQAASERTLDGQRELAQEAQKLSANVSSTLEQSKQISKGMSETLEGQRRLLKSGETLHDSQRSLLQSGEQLQEVMIRSEFPLEPLELQYSFRYSMTDPRIADYVERVRREILEYLTKHPDSSHRSPSDELRGRKWYLTDPDQEWKPRLNSPDRMAASLLLSDRTIFALEDTGRGFNNRIELGCTTDPRLGSRPSSSGKLDLTISLVAFFADGYIEKLVTCINPFIGGNDVVVSSIDLLGRKVMWDELASYEETRTLFWLYFTLPKLGSGLPAYPADNRSITKITQEQLNIRDFIKLKSLIR
jgi:hypothetical protein